MTNDCGCNQNINICGQPTCQETSCACEVYISSDCINDVKADFNCLPIASHLDLTQTLEAMDAAICDKFSSITNYVDLVNVGGKSEVYKGSSLIGQKQLRTISDNGEINPLLTIIQNSNTIGIVQNRENLTTFIENLIPTVENGLTTIANGDGITFPYSIEVANLQKVITSNYTLNSGDNQYTIIVDTTLGNIEINVPIGLVENISVNFTQIGTGLVTFINTGTIINSPTGLKIKGENYWANIYQRQDTPDTYQLAGALKL